MDETKIIVGKNKLTKEEIGEMENFDQLVEKHQQFLWRKKLMTGGLIAAGVFIIGALVLFVNSREDEPKETEIREEVVSRVKGVSRPFDVSIIQDTFLVDNQLGGEFNYKNTLILVPANAFIDSNGNQIEGQVKLTYREFHTPEEAFVSGIPMIYDSAETEFHFETAGMFEIKGYKDNNEVQLNKDIEVQLGSFQEGEYYNQYYFNQETNEWEFIQKDRVTKRDMISPEVLESARATYDSVQTELNNIEKDKPKEKSSTSVCVKLELDETEFPEFSSLKDVLFEVDKKDEKKYAKMASVEYDDVKLVKKGDQFELHIFKRFKKTKLKVTPVYEGEALEKVLYEFNAKNKEKKATLSAMKNRLEQTLASAEAERKFQSNPENFVTRIFMVNNFGIYNSDCPQRMPKGQLLAIEYIEKSDKKEKDTLKLVSLYLVEENKNTLYTLRPESTLSFNPNNKCALWGVTIDSKLVILTAKEFAKIPRNYSGIYNLEFELIENDLFSEENIIKKLKIEALFSSI